MDNMTGKDYRITVLTDRLIRLEYQRDGKFEDRLTRMVVNRDFDKVEYIEKKTETGVVVQTDELRLFYDEKPFSTDGLMIQVKSMDTTWHYSIVYANSDGNYLGTARTLDLTDGFAELEPGIFGRNGFAVIDDSLSPVMVSDPVLGFGNDSVFENRENEGIDIYFFALLQYLIGGHAGKFIKVFLFDCGRVDHRITLGKRNDDLSRIREYHDLAGYVRNGYMHIVNIAPVAAVVIEIIKKILPDFGIHRGIKFAAFQHIPYAFAVNMTGAYIAQSYLVLGVCIYVGDQYLFACPVAYKRTYHNDHRYHEKKLFEHQALLFHEYYESY